MNVCFAPMPILAKGAQDYYLNGRLRKRRRKENKLIPYTALKIKIIKTNITVVIPGPNYTYCINILNNLGLQESKDYEILEGGFVDAVGDFYNKEKAQEELLKVIKNYKK